MQAENITYLSNEELDRRHHDATQAWSVKLARVLMNDWMRAIMPTLYDIYQTPDSFEVTFVPDDIQLPLLFMQYNSIAMRNFTARPSFNLRDHIMNRVIWYWNLDPTHSFSRQFRMVRYNLILMAFAWASGFKEEYFPKPGVEKFVKLFIQAWIESLVDHREWIEGAFQAREEFLDYWQVCRLDLINFSRADVEKMKKITRELNKMPIDEALTESPKTFIEDCRSGRISDEQFEKYGPMLAIRWLHEYQQDAEYMQADIDATFEAEAEQEQNEDQAMFEEEMDVVDDGIDEMDIADEKCGFHIVGDSAGGHPFSTADWNCEALAYLMEPIQPGLPDPTSLRFRATEEDKQRFWMEPRVIFNEIFKKKEVKVDMVDVMGSMQKLNVDGQHDSVGMTTLARLMGQVAIE